MSKIEVGKPYKFTPSAFFGEKKGMLAGQEVVRSVTGTITYKNEAHRMFTVAAKANGHRIVESFKY